ncbi:MAG: response regulator [Gammaproteobacteria bacterium]|nr:response regulator [Gammaproteobacteria bacterium]
MRILLVEDEPILGDAVQSSLRLDGYAVDWVQDGQSALAALRTTDYAAMVLDIGLPKLDGLQVLSNLRAAHNAIPVLLLTARHTIEDRITGLDRGADDYLCKPFDLGELSARVRALTRRQPDLAQSIITIGNLSLNTSAKQVQLDDQTVELSAKEFSVLHDLMCHAGQVRSRGQLEAALYDWAHDIESNAIEVHIHHLRKKLGSQRIKTVRGMGYKIEH